MNQLHITFRSHWCNGWPRARISLDGDIIVDHEFSQDIETIMVMIDRSPGPHAISVHRHGKGIEHMEFDANGDIVRDQILEITDLHVQQARIPDYVLDQNSRFEFDDQCHAGSRYFGPNGVWTFEFATPMVTWVLDQKIKQEAQYNQDFQYSWSTQLGPDSAKNILTQINAIKQRLDQLDLGNI